MYDKTNKMGWDRNFDDLSYKDTILITFCLYKQGTSL